MPDISLHARDKDVLKSRPAPAGNELIVFLHIPRTGGTTFRTILTKQYARSEVLLVQNDQELKQLEAMSGEQRNRLRIVTGHVGFAFDTVLPKPFHYVTFLRDPVARVASVYQLIRATPEHTFHEVVTKRNLSLGDFVRERISVMNIDNGMTRLLSGAPNDAREIGFGQCTTSMLEAAKKNLRERVAVVGLTEHFDTSLVLMRRRFRWKSPLYKIANASKGGRTTIDPEAAVLIEKHNELDRELYRYATGLFRKQVLAALPWIPVQARYFQYKNRVQKQDPGAFERLRQFEYKRIARWLDLK